MGIGHWAVMVAFNGREGSGRCVPPPTALPGSSSGSQSSAYWFSRSSRTTSDGHPKTVPPSSRLCSSVAARITQRPDPAMVGRSAFQARRCGQSTTRGSTFKMDVEIEIDVVLEPNLDVGD